MKRKDVKQERGKIARKSEPADCSAEHIEALLDDALDDTFPASDPPSIVTPHRRRS